MQSRLGLRAIAVVSVLALALWLGGLVVLGAIVAPTVFALASYPSSADAMTMVFRRFDTVAMSCAAIVLVTEAIQAAVTRPFAVVDRWRAATSALAAALAVLEGTVVSPRIAALHWAGVVRGVGGGGMELARLHEMAEHVGKAQVVLLVAVLALRVFKFSGS